MDRHLKTGEGKKRDARVLSDEKGGEKARREGHKRKSDGEEKEERGADFRGGGEVLKR